MISEDNLTIKLGSKLICKNSKLVIIEGEHYAIVGQNGSGKTTLLEYIINNTQLDNYYVDQNIVIESNTQTVLDFMLRANLKIYEINKKVIELEGKLEESNNIEFETYKELINTNEYLEYNVYISESKKILDGLGITKHDALIYKFSGGWRMRLAIARALISKPSLLIMDEPSNHLDLNANIWLGKYLKDFKKTLIVSSHNIDFINQFCNLIIYIGSPDFNEPKIYINKGNYYNLEDFLIRVNNEATNSYNKYEKGKKGKKGIELENYITKNFKPRPPKIEKTIIEFSNDIEINTFANKLISFENVSFSYGSKMIINNLNFNIGSNDRYIIVGNNGIGKTTFFDLCYSKIIPTNGNINFDERIRIGYYNQQIYENLPLELTSIEYLQNLDNSIDNQEARKILSKVGIKENMCQIKINLLSGGQKARLSFAAIQINKPHILLLDEPSNHLDINWIKGLLDGINKYKGTIIIITHDFYIISKINNYRLLQLKDYSLEIFNGDIDDYINEVIV
jgi:ATP-binding cassette subfamily F protein 3